MEAKHTATPWKVDKYGVITGGETFCTSIAECYVPPKLRNDNPMTIMSTIMEQQINAEFIVRAVNAHEGLLETVHSAAAFYHDSSDGDICTDKRLCLYCKAITKAEGSTP